VAARIEQTEDLDRLRAATRQVFHLTAPEELKM
jgi:hypothetical protein